MENNFIKSISIENFRAFKKKTTINLGKGINIISGPNGVGKSTILGLLANSAEMSGKDEPKQLNNKKFRGDFGDVVIYDPGKDIFKGNNSARYSVTFNNIKGIKDNKIEFRSTKQKAANDTNRFRFIPKLKENRQTEAKIHWPVIYLGLSRIYPIGESDKASKSKILDEKIGKEVIKIHKYLMGERIDENTSQFNSIRLSNLGSKMKSGINTKDYSSTSNSSGQDTLGQIILAVMSFKELKEQMQEKYTGGLLVIDELDVTLHPAVQNKLLNWLYEQIDELQIQIVFTTHSVSLLKDAMRMQKIDKNHSNNLKITYIRNVSGEIEVKNQLNLDFIINDLNDEYNKFNRDNTINIYTEDEVARFFLKQIIQYNPVNQNDKVNSDLKKYSSILKVLDINVPWTSLINIMTSDEYQFQNSIFILDPDLSNGNMKEDLKQMLTKSYSKVRPNDKNGNLILLPGDDAIERMLFEYIENMSPKHEFFKDRFIEYNGVTKERIVRDGPNSDKYKNLSDSNDTEKYKKWYDDNRFYMDTLIQYWIKDNYDEVNTFKECLYEKIRKIYSNISI